MAHHPVAADRLLPVAGLEHQLTGPEDATRTVNFWLDQGVDNFKAYMFITRAELGAAIDAITASFDAHVGPLGVHIGPLAALLGHRVVTAHADGTVSPLSVLLDD